MPGQIGCLGDIVFQVNSRTVQTLTNLILSGSADIAEHKRAGKKALTEFTGSNPRKAKFNMILSSELGVNVDREADKIIAHSESGTPLPLVVGRKMYGQFRWQINSYDISINAHDSDGNAVLATATVNLLEYLHS
jgi:phage protein U